MIQFLQQTGPTYAGTNDVVCPVAVMGARLWGDVGSSAKSLRGPSTERARRSSARPSGSAWWSASPNPPSLRQFKGSVSSQVRYRAAITSGVAASNSMHRRQQFLETVADVS